MAKVAKRPGIVSLIGILGYVSGIIKVLTGTVLLLDKNRLELFEGQNVTNTALLWAAVVSILAGLLTLFVANSLMNGQKWTQVWFGLLMTISLVINLIYAFTHGGPARWSYLAGALISFIALQLLFNERSQEYFEE